MRELTGISGNYYSNPYPAVNAGRKVGKDQDAKLTSGSEKTGSAEAAAVTGRQTEESSNISRDALETIRKSITGANSLRVLTAVQNTEIGSKAIGDVKLSKEGQEYYDKLRAKFGNMDFILVSEDQKEAAKAQASSFSSPGKMTVLIDEAKIEKMATDPEYRDKYEGIIAMAQMQLPKIQDTMSSLGLPQAQSFGVSVGDKGETNYFAVMKQTTDSANKIAAKAAEKRKETKKAAEKVADKKAAEKAAREKSEAKKAEKKEAANQAEEARKAEKAEEDAPVSNGDGTVTIHASSLEELLQKMIDYAGQANEEDGSYQHINLHA